MDPFSALIISVLVAKYLVSYGVTDAIAAWKGTESPRDRDRAARQERARAQLSSGRGPTIGQAMSSRIADRIANPPPKKLRGPFRTWMGQLWGDIVDEAAMRTDDNMRDRRARYEARRLIHVPGDERDGRGENVASTVVEDDILDAEVVEPQPEPKPGPRWVSTVPKCPICREPMVRDSGRDSERHADGTVTVPLKCYGCLTTSEHTVPDPMPRACRACSAPDVPLTSDALCPACAAASKRGEDHEESGESGESGDEPTEPVDLVKPVKPVDTSTPAATDTTTGEGPAMSSSDLDPETFDPASAQRFAEAVAAALEQAHATTVKRIDELIAGGVAGDVIAAYQNMADQLAYAKNETTAAAEEFGRHIDHAQVLAADPSLRGTQAGRYLDTARA